MTQKNDNPTPTHSAAATPAPASPASRAIRRLNAQLLSLADGDDPPDAATVERTARAITSLIRAIEQAQGFLDAQGEGERVGWRLPEAARLELLERIRIAAGRGLIPGVIAVEADQ